MEVYQCRKYVEFLALNNASVSSFLCRTKSRRCPTYPRAASYQNPGRSSLFQLLLMYTEESTASVVSLHVTA